MAKKKVASKKSKIEPATPDMMLLGYKGNRKNVVYAQKKFNKGDVHPVPVNLKNAINETMKAEGFYIASTSKTEVTKALEAEKPSEPTNKPSDELNQ